MIREEYSNENIHSTSSSRSSQKLSDIEQREKDIAEHEDDIYYSPRYADDHHEFRHVTLPKQIAKWLPQG